MTMEIHCARSSSSPSSFSIRLHQSQQFTLRTCRILHPHGPPDPKNQASSSCLASSISSWYANVHFTTTTVSTSVFPKSRFKIASPVSFVRRFSYKDMKRATNGFNSLIQRNANGAAYKAVFSDGYISLVKEVGESDHGLDVFYKEVQLLGQLHHRHLLGLRGYSTGRKRLLVFDNIENGSLKEHLNDPLKTPLNWRTRLQIASGVAAALEYLLMFIDPPLCHVSVSSSNIMLDDNFTAKLSDVGLLGSGGKYGTNPHSSCSKDCMGQECGNIVVQLGVLILELISGQSSDKGGINLIQWVQDLRFGTSIYKMIDPDLGNDYDSRELKKLLAVARLCIKSGDKPTISAIHLFRYLQKKVNIPH